MWGVRDGRRTERRHEPHDAEAQKDAKPVAQLDIAQLDTLLLDRFDNESLGENNTTRAEVIGGLVGESGGTLHGTLYLTDSPRPGIALFKEPD